MDQSVRRADSEHPLIIIIKATRSCVDPSDPNSVKKSLSPFPLISDQCTRTGKGPAAGMLHNITYYQDVSSTLEYRKLYGEQFWEVLAPTKARLATQFRWDMMQ